VLEAEKENMITEDERYKLLEQLDKTVGEWNEKIKKVGDEKESEIMTI
jgi:ribosome recycling factor